jgi:hypothetical protein
VQEYGPGHYECPDTSEDSACQDEESAADFPAAAATDAGGQSEHVVRGGWWTAPAPGHPAGQELAGTEAVDQDGELSAEDLAKEFPRWQVWRGICHMWYGRLLNSSPPVIVRGEDPTDLRDEIIRKVSDLEQPRF